MENTLIFYISSWFFLDLSLRLRRIYSHLSQSVLQLYKNTSTFTSSVLTG